MAKKRIIVITGVTRGIGYALVAEMIALGHTVVGCGRSEIAIASLSKKYGGGVGGEGGGHFSVVDVTDMQAVAGWAKVMIDQVGVPDLLINNAAIINKNANLWEVPVEEFDRVVDINIKGVANVTRAFVPAMIEKGSGVIVNLSSGWGRSVSPQVGPYCATKWAIEGMTKSLAEELPHGMAAVPVSPGMVHTKMLDSCFGEGAEYSPKPIEWVKKAAPFLLGLGAKDNGKSLTTQ